MSTDQTVQFVQCCLCSACSGVDNRPYSGNARADTGGKYHLLAWAFHTAATVINNLFSSLLLGFQVTVISEYSRLVCVGDRKLSCKRQKYIRGDKGRRLQKRSGTAEGLQAHRRPYCKDSVRWAISWNALLYSRDTSHTVAVLRSTSSNSLESPTPSRQPPRATPSEYHVSSPGK